MLLTEIIEQGRERRPDAPALAFRDCCVTYGELAAAVRNLAAGLAGLGLRASDRLAILLPNCPEFVYGYYAGAALGVQVVPANPLLKPPELAYIWGDAGVRAVLAAAPLLPVAVAARRDLPGLEALIVVGEMPPAAAGEPGTVPFATVMAAGAAGVASGWAAPPPADDTSCAVIIYTSGTTGYPKGAMLSHKNLTANVSQVQAALEIDGRDRFLTVLPLFHSFAATVCMNTALACGSLSVLQDSFAPKQTLEELAQRGITLFAGVPAMFNAMLMVPADRTPMLPHLRLLVSGGAPLPAGTLAALEERYRVPVLEGDGPTECSPVTSVNPPEGMRKVGSVGLPLPGVQIAIFDDEDRLLPTGEIGEIVVRGDNVMLGYLNQPEETAQAMRSGWYHTGDLGSIDEDGYVYIVDRKKDMVITAGLNVYPREVEQALLCHEAVRDAAVIGVSDALRGEDVVAVVVLQTDIPVTERELIAHCRDRLASFKAPRRVLFRDTLPYGSTGKVVKRLLKKELELESQP